MIIGIFFFEIPEKPISSLLKPFLVLIWLNVFLLPCLSQVIQENKWDCGQGKDKKEEIWLTNVQLKKRATRIESAKLIGQVSIAKKVEIVVDVFIDPEGIVKCSRVEKGHPILRSSALEAVRKWTFRQYKVKGKPVGIWGQIVFKFNPESREGVP